MFYNGLVPSLVGLVHVGVQFPLYEWLKKLFVESTVLSSSSSPPPLSLPSTQLSYPSIIAASVLSKIAATASTYPHEVIRTRLQTQERAANGIPVKYTGVLRTLQLIYREEGWRAFYSGLGTNMVRTLPASAVTLLTFEFVNKHLKDWKENLHPVR